MIYLLSTLEGPVKGALVSGFHARESLGMDGIRGLKLLTVGFASLWRAGIDLGPQGALGECLLQLVDGPHVDPVPGSE